MLSKCYVKYQKLKNNYDVLWQLFVTSCARDAEINDNLLAVFMTSCARDTETNDNLLAIFVRDPETNDNLLAIFVRDTETDDNLLAIFVTSCARETQKQMILYRRPKWSEYYEENFSQLQVENYTCSSKFRLSYFM